MEKICSHRYNIKPGVQDTVFHDHVCILYMKLLMDNTGFDIDVKSVETVYQQEGENLIMRTYLSYEKIPNGYTDDWNVSIINGGILALTVPFYKHEEWIKEHRAALKECVE